MELLKLLESIRTPFLDALISGITYLGAEMLFMIVALAFFWCVDKHRGYYLLFTGFCGTVCIQFLKMMFRVPRPWVLDPNFTIVESARAEATGYSFPSGHTQIAVNLYGGIARSSKRSAVQVGGVVLFLLIAFSRMYLGVHTPKDVLVSLVIGTAFVLVIYPIMERARTNPRIMYGIIACAFLLALGNLLYVELWQFPTDVDAVNLTNAKEVAWKLFAAVVGICLIYPTDQKYIHFETHAIWWAQILKVAGGLAVIVLIKSLLKTPLNALFGASIGGFVRYLIMVLTAGLLWPLSFRFFARLGKKL
ncbi:MAG: phosphatase PAP2 family protein [Clostridia bacterium]|nr:phosphatase PAP2 family protein [Clostridia bacterium]